MLIHTAKRRAVNGECPLLTIAPDSEGRDLAWLPISHELDEDAPPDPKALDGAPFFELTYGSVVCTATLADCVPIVDFTLDVAPPMVYTAADTGELVLWRSSAGSTGPCHFGGDWSVIEDQRPYGDFTPGRFAWILEDVVELAAPVPWKGAQGLWEADVDGTWETVAADVESRMPTEWPDGESMHPLDQVDPVFNSNAFMSRVARLPRAHDDKDELLRIHWLGAARSVGEWTT